MQGDSQLVRSSEGEVSCSGTPRNTPIDLATFRLHSNPLYLLSYADLNGRPTRLFNTGDGGAMTLQEAEIVPLLRC